MGIGERELQHRHGKSTAAAEGQVLKAGTQNGSEAEVRHAAMKMALAGPQHGTPGPLVKSMTFHSQGSAQTLAPCDSACRIILPHTAQPLARCVTFTAGAGLPVHRGAPIHRGAPVVFLHQQSTRSTSFSHTLCVVAPSQPHRVVMCSDKQGPHTN